MQKKKIVTAVAVAAFGVSLGIGAMTAQAEFRPATQGAMETRTGVPVGPGQDSAEDKLPASERFVSSKDMGSQLEYQLCLPRWYDSSKSYPLIVVINDVAGETDGRALLKQPDGVSAWVDELEKNQQYAIVLTIQTTQASDARIGHLTSTEGMNVLRGILKDVRQNYGVNKDAIYGIGENKGAWAIQLINEQLPSYFKAFYNDENTADGKIDNKVIHDWLMKEMASQAK
ncbi:hypothetical protein SAMN04487861_102112 [Selenomonas ruminantium]|uniref:Esterase n=1 Tax=Selenomonas ruminantium TaxID=971 RepID=A0A1I6XVP9_SELRU|nr:hypothetical protein [Selenomonas ruminantium]SFH68856.1 hypothetical protein SAMN04487861_102112 [Selenomonas ruminantium]SFT42042.1 hypothetical protein SAMN02910356_00562 [Selenomonas ruminantium]